MNHLISTHISEQIHNFSMKFVEAGAKNGASSQKGKISPCSKSRGISYQVSGNASIF